MLNSRAKLVLAPLVALAAIMLAGTASAAPPASIDWITQPSQTVLTFTGTIGTVNLDNNGDPVEDGSGNVIYSELYSAVPQTDVGTSAFPGITPFNDSIHSAANGVFTTTGNTFLSSLNWGSRIPDNTPVSALKTHVVNNGNWLPNQNGDNPPGVYGVPQAANAAFKLNAVEGQPPGANGGDGGRVALFGLAGTVGSNDNSVAVTMAGDFNSASFSAAPLEIQGTLGLAANYNGNIFQIDPQAYLTPELYLTFNGGVGRLDNNDANVGSIVRGAGANSSDYLQIVHFLDNISVAFGTSGGLGFNLVFPLDIAFTAKANLRPGDSNFDGIVDVSDIQLIAANYLLTGKLRSGNANGDGIVDVSDIQLIAANYLQTTPPLPGGGAGAAVPEPASLVLLGVGFVGLAFVRRRVRK